MTGAVLRRFSAAVIALLFATPAASARDACAQRDPLRQPFFGDLHVHTRYSLDASTQGTRTRPADAYRFARGEEIGLQPFNARGEAQRSARLARPLDFAAVTDHAELFGEVNLCRTPGSDAYDSIVCGVYRGWPRLAFFLMNARGAPRFDFCGEDGQRCVEAGLGPWREMREAAESAYDRSAECRFTSFVGYEWTKIVGVADNLHRNVIFRSDAVPGVPASAIEAPTPEDLWESLERECRDALPGCDAIVIPHNSNISGGFMFAPEELRSGEPFDADHARQRADFEPLVEIMQHKGDSECRLGAGTRDELCTHEILPYDSFIGRFLPLARAEPAAINFTRTALGEGLRHRARLGINPFHFGVIASTDTHLGTPGLVEERDYPGHGGAGIPIGDTLPDMLLDPIEYNPGGLAAVWAEENTRESLFDALRRRETYGTSGPRIAFRLFAGWELGADICGPDFAARGYAEGVAMGGTLGAPPSTDATPTLAAWALKDPGSPDAPGLGLERLQIIKLWLEGDEVREQVVDVAGERSDSFDARSCENLDEGSPQLCQTWRDPDFDTDEHALYYARVVQVPSCRWSARACDAAGVRCDGGRVPTGWEACCDEDFPREVRERAWTSAIWYAPPAR